MDLELISMDQQKFIEEMNEELLGARNEIETLRAKVSKLEEILHGLASPSDRAPLDEKPPHY